MEFVLADDVESVHNALDHNLHKHNSSFLSKWGSVPVPGAYFQSSEKLQDAVVHGSVCADQGEHSNQVLHHSWIFSFHVI